MSAGRVRMTEAQLVTPILLAYLRGRLDVDRAGVWMMVAVAVGTLGISAAEIAAMAARTEAMARARRRAVRAPTQRGRVPAKRAPRG